MSEGTKESLSIWNKIEPHEDAEYYNRKFIFNKNFDKEMKKMRKHAGYKD